MDAFNPFDWYWSVGGDATRFWSTRTGGYVSEADRNRLSDIDAERGLSEFLSNYGLPGPYTPPPVLLPYQFFAMLEISGKKAALDAFINALPSPQNIVARTKLDRSLEFHRDNDLVLAAQQALGLTDQELDQLWMQAASL